MTVENGQHSTSQGEASFWDYGPIDCIGLKERSLLYARAAGAGEKLQGRDYLFFSFQKCLRSAMPWNIWPSAALRMC